ncbi:MULTISPECIES: GNAT family N-acetyltransferase [Rhizobium]|uniref:GNAT family N-acetyltransferase n=1 Tax=Rhizobium tropici TaxID=398 RepID=A0A6P1C8T1_RHITR|nr:MULTISPECIES: GNAT family N-acetyltransferase [Rhizobium]AGB69535.1 putative acetyltransferase [Rhizobium tropici CIAT 899]MBB4244434.1 RimJ/RimL family protein N-acetyltransferase [Rhizobium tropici]MBB5595622.1 RimJ/RimL family protein N-acetyltransferase [Rhizobium tropici]MBB6494773.1 RimJ/RimL family protein N-acetyltransferase [Rhizobium tropici]NEV13157.1 GNAT family N-acetyltransferase [Rhizobium tropici]
MTSNDAELLASTDRLVLRRFVPEDFVAYSAYRSLPEIYRFLYRDPPSPEEMRERFDTSLNSPFSEDGDTLRCAVIRREDGALVGDVSLTFANKAALQAELGYTSNPAYARKGYATEAAEAMITLSFEKFGFRRIFARLDAKNAGSIGVVERLGLRREALLIESDRFNGIWGDECVYAVLSREWAARAPNRAR